MEDLSLIHISFLQVLQIGGQAEHCHNLAGHGDVKAVLPGGAVGLATQAVHDIAQLPVVHVHAPPPSDPPGVDAQGIALLDVVVQHGGCLLYTSTSPSKYPTLKKYGADYCLNPKELGDKLGDEIRKICGNPVGADVVFECAGNMNSLSNCINYCIKPGGQVVVIGTIQEPMGNLVPGSFSIHEPELKFTFVYTAEEVRMYLEMLATGKVEFPGMVTDVIPLTQCVDCLLYTSRCV